MAAPFVSAAPCVPAGPSASAFSAWSALRGVERLSLCDWPGKTCAVLFFGGCNLRCPHCHNAGIAWTPERHPELFAPDVRKLLSVRSKWLDGIVVSGGEPTLVPDLADFLAFLRGYGLPVKLDTNGSRPEVVAELLAAGLVDAVSVDVKAPFAKYSAATGERLDPVAAQACLTRVFALAVAHPGRFFFRTTATPQVGPRDLDAIRALLPDRHVLTVQPYVQTSEEGSHATADTQTRRTRGDLVARTDRPGDPEGAQGQRSERPDPGQAAGRQG
ncbi:MAG: anaerobic ribonucleoside-triphosphate reductase activating protein [Desulfovibrionaceae bacterium]|nr:anaerobic ribonucleoside-triphosphate reductase activating protein [Desulfovibrionaceae bacterium]MBF0513836.1 anaerobic ribonucleoside-triphosphate reductase activating protein [Desulfovibrionaceae bacterium]